MNQNQSSHILRIFLLALLFSLADVAEGVSEEELDVAVLNPEVELRPPIFCMPPGIAVMEELEDVEVPVGELEADVVVAELEGVPELPELDEVVDGLAVVQTDEEDGELVSEPDSDSD